MTWPATEKHISKAREQTYHVVRLLFEDCNGDALVVSKHNFAAMIGRSSSLARSHKSISPPPPPPPPFFPACSSAGWLPWSESLHEIGKAERKTSGMQHAINVIKSSLSWLQAVTGLSAELPTRCSVQVKETPELFLSAHLPYIHSIPPARIQWVYNILEGKVTLGHLLSVRTCPLT